MNGLARTGRAIMIRDSNRPGQYGSGKLTTSHLARRFGMQAGTLLNRLIGRGFVEVKNGRKCLTNDGKEVGGEEIAHRSKGRLIVWPQDLLLKILE